MAQVLTQEGALLAWRTLIGVPPLMGVPYCRLLGGPYTPSHSDTMATLAAHELAVAGYRPQPVNAGSWTAVATADGMSAVATALQYALTSPTDVWGYWLCDHGQTVSWLAEGFPAPVQGGGPGGPLLLTLTVYLVSQPYSLGVGY